MIKIWYSLIGVELLSIEVFRWCIDVIWRIIVYIVVCVYDFVILYLCGSIEFFGIFLFGCVVVIIVWVVVFLFDGIDFGFVDLIFDWWFFYDRRRFGVGWLVYLLCVYYVGFGVEVIRCVVVDYFCGINSGVVFGFVSVEGNV